ncbi:MAG: hypothetical protein HC905_28050 [Bacteroidales bacterium]|nr:hypothetical protein [Bacteroidales bacterium]
MYAKISSPLFPFIHGGHQEEGMRAGTESVHNIAGFGKACNQVNKQISYSNDIKLLKEHFIEQLKIVKPDILVNSPSENCLSNTISVSLPAYKSADELMIDAGLLRHFRIVGFSMQHSAKQAIACTKSNWFI